MQNKLNRRLKNKEIKFLAYQLPGFSNFFLYGFSLSLLSPIQGTLLFMHVVRVREREGERNEFSK